MTLSLAEIKDLISFGQDLGLKQLQTEGLIVVYGDRAVLPATPADAPAESDAESITAMYAAIGKGKVR